jgi:hypothetical protein
VQSRGFVADAQLADAHERDVGPLSCEGSS